MRIGNMETTILDSVNGAPLGMNDFWVGVVQRGTNPVRSANRFTVPTNSFIFTTTTTTTITATTTTITSGSTSTRTSTTHSTTSQTTLTSTTDSTITTSTATSFTGSTSSTTTTRTMAVVRVRCPSYSSWSNILGMTCGNCEALVAAAPFNATCGRYCSAIGLECVAAFDDISGTCARKNQVDCNVPVPNAGQGILCTCQSSASSLRAAQCAAYSRWPQIDVDTCGGCTAVVPLGQPSVSDSCSDYCISFGHTCSAAGVQGSTTCAIGQNLSCQDRVAAGVHTLCKCVQ